LQAAANLIERTDDLIELRAFAPELLRPIGRIPDLGIF
jgi:hypothetical protein